MSYDAIVIGGGPAGAVAAMVMARQGRSVLVVERDNFPRFHIGESFLPRNYDLLCELGLEDKLNALPNVPKFGAEFGMGGSGETTLFNFNTGLTGGGARAFNLARADFDRMLLDEARAAGAEVRQPAKVTRILHLADGDVRIEVDGKEERAKYVIDASGQGTVVARHLGTRRLVDDRHLQKVAYFGHYENVARRDGAEAGHPLVLMLREGWFWFIPLDERRTSVGVVLDAKVAKQIDVPANRVLTWAINQCGDAAERMGDAVGPDTNEVAADFTYTCAPYAGPGYFLVGDAATFLDPVFSTGVHLGMASGQRAGELVVDLVSGKRRTAQARKNYLRFMDGSYRHFCRLIRHYYDHSFRELFLHGKGPFELQRAVLAILAGHVVPRPPWAVLWRFLLFEQIIKFNKLFQMVPRRECHSLLNPTINASSQRSACT